MVSIIVYNAVSPATVYLLLFFGCAPTTATGSRLIRNQPFSEISSDTPVPSTNRSCRHLTFSRSYLLLNRKLTTPILWRLWIMPRLVCARAGLAEFVARIVEDMRERYGSTCSEES